MERTALSRTAKSSLLPGTLDMIVLQILHVQPMHGYAISQQVARLSHGQLAADPGSLYPSLDRLQRKGWIRSRWMKSPTGRRARYYTITSSGEQRLGHEVDAFERFIVALRRVMQGSASKA